MKRSISIVIPAHRETRKTLKNSLALLNSKLSQYELDVVIVENGSQELDSIKGSRYFEVEKLGLGIALKFGIEKAANEDTFFLPADMSYDLSFVDFALSTDADMVIGSKKVRGSIVDRPMTSKIVSSIYSLYVREFGGVNVHDVTGAKLYRRSKIIPLLADTKSIGIGFEVELVRLALEKGLKVKEIPVIVHDRDKGGVLRWVR